MVNAEETTVGSWESCRRVPSVPLFLIVCSVLELPCEHFIVARDLRTLDCLYKDPVTGQVNRRYVRPMRAQWKIPSWSENEELVIIARDERNQEIEMSLYGFHME
jgi:hypothetical protein